MTVTTRTTNHALIAPLTGTNPDLAYALVAWQSFTEAGDILAGLVRDEIGAETSLQLVADRAPLKEWISILGYQPQHLAEGIQQWTHRYDRDRIRHILEQSQRLDLALITPDHPHWPERLNDLGPSAPAALWAAGNPAILGQLEHSATITGSRAATTYGMEATTQIIDRLTLTSAVIVAGGAMGIDSTAHQTALATQSRTVAVLPSGLDLTYSAARTELLNKIRLNGALVSELPPHTTPTRWRTLQRNRLLGTISTGTIITEASERSGALNTAAHASAHGRPIGAVPGPITSPNSAGCHRLLTEAGAALITTGEEAVDLIRTRN